MTRDSTGVQTAVQHPLLKVLAVLLTFETPVADTTLAIATIHVSTMERNGLLHCEHGLMQYF
jgi:hypothetical protein